MYECAVELNQMNIARALPSYKKRAQASNVPGIQSTYVLARGLLSGIMMQINNRQWMEI